tara:strand:- start:533 stop:913 length:381 start_codon:yes stop_codon:yes gene_type:complete
MKPTELIKNAIKAQKRSKSQYSNFAVGCSLLSIDNDVILGCNIESAAYPSTICAERVAIYSAISQGIVKFKAIAIVSPIKAKPCGQCRQIIFEYLGNIPIYVSDGINNEFEEHYIDDLLPFGFRNK